MAAPSELRLIKVPRWVSEQWLKGKPGDVVANLDLQSGTLCLTDTGTGKPSVLQVERRASPELFAFSLPEKVAGDVEVPIDGLIVESLSLRPNLQDGAYRNLVQRRVEDGALGANNRSQHLERIRQHEDRIDEAKATKKAPPPAEVPKASASLEQVAEQVERALKAAGRQGATLKDLLASLSGGCSLEQMRDCLMALAVPWESEDGSRRYVYAPCLGTARGGDMLRWEPSEGFDSHDFGSGKAGITRGHLQKRPRTSAEGM
eukprot:TRINITY_DN113393_c0_g1_i1.p1 TRINITY_DN113393_c0_g1~~TRINITY_DN113393_c0_g1_i1.p1  ORF type:complete len:268 (-),score=58.94 TRINITY_DN113393_c0_g1_i1:19-801(-)